MPCSVETETAQKRIRPDFNITSKTMSESDGIRPDVAGGHERGGRGEEAEADDGG